MMTLQRICFLTSIKVSAWLRGPAFPRGFRARGLGCDLAVAECKSRVLRE